MESEISFPLLCIFNASMSSFSIPSDWAMGIVVPVYKMVLPVTSIIIDPFHSPVHHAKL